MANTEEKFFEELAKSAHLSASPKLQRDEPNEQESLSHHYKMESEEDSIQKVISKENNYPLIEIEGKLTIDVYQTPTEIVVESAIAGVKPEDMDINVSSDSVTIGGERKHEEKIEEGNYFYQECYWGRFSRSVILPEEVDPDSATVNFKNGVLTVRLPKIGKKKTRNLKLKVE